MNELKIIEISKDLIQKDFGLDDEIDFAEAVDENILLNNLIKVVQYLLDHDFERLLNVMYRVDLPENRVEKVLSAGDPENLSRELSVMILARERGKAITRIQYSK